MDFESGFKVNIKRFSLVSRSSCIELKECSNSLLPTTVDNPIVDTTTTTTTTVDNPIGDTVDNPIGDTIGVIV